jgi:hypothetical protein
VRFKTLLPVFSAFVAAHAAEIPETQTRSGLPNVIKKLSAGEEVRVAYLGGSITEAKGWRVLSREWLQKEYPEAKVSEINAAISGTTSAFGAFRVGRKVLADKPDLLFIEFAVNDSGGDPLRIRRAMEGIVRQTWQMDPATDICFIYTLQKGDLPAYQGGHLPVAVENMEKVATHYDIPCINFGPEISRLDKAGKLIFTGKLPATAEEKIAQDKIIFTGDGVHPHVETGHPLYLAAIQRSWPLISAASKGTTHVIPAPLDAAAWQAAELVPLKDIQREGNWKELDATSPAIANAVSRVPAMWRAEGAGDSLTFSFTGTCFGIYSLKGPDCGNYRVTVDALPPIEAARFDSFCVADRWRISPWIYPSDLPDGVHHVRVEALGTAPDKKAILKNNFATLPADQRDGTRLYLSDVMVIGHLTR